jgi:hypothetical protein
MSEFTNHNPIPCAFFPDLECTGECMYVLPFGACIHEPLTPGHGDPIVEEPGESFR